MARTGSWSKWAKSLFKVEKPLGSEPWFNPEDVTHQKREWIETQSESKPELSWPKHIYEQFVVVGLPPDCDVTQIAQDLWEVEHKQGHDAGRSDGASERDVEHTQAPQPAYAPEVIWRYPTDSHAPISDAEIASLCFPHQVAPSKLRRTPSLSALDEVVYGQQNESDQCFVYQLKVAGNFPLYGVCWHVREVLHRPPYLARARYSSCKAPFRQCMVAVPRCYCLITHYPFFELHFKLLQMILDLERLERLLEYDHERSSREPPMVSPRPQTQQQQQPEQREHEQQKQGRDVGCGPAAVAASPAADAARLPADAVAEASTAAAGVAMTVATEQAVSTSHTGDSSGLSAAAAMRPHSAAEVLALAHQPQPLPAPQKLPSHPPQLQVPRPATPEEAAGFDAAAGRGFDGAAGVSGDERSAWRGMMAAVKAAGQKLGMDDGPQASDAAQSLASGPEASNGERSSSGSSLLPQVSMVQRMWDTFARMPSAAPTPKQAGEGLGRLFSRTSSRSITPTPRAASGSPQPIRAWSQHKMLHSPSASPGPNGTPDGAVQSQASQRSMQPHQLPMSHGGALQGQGSAASDYRQSSPGRLQAASHAFQQAHQHQHQLQQPHQCLQQEQRQQPPAQENEQQKHQQQPPQPDCSHGPDKGDSTAALLSSSTAAVLPDAAAQAGPLPLGLVPAQLRELSTADSFHTAADEGEPLPEALDEEVAAAAATNHLESAPSMASWHASEAGPLQQPQQEQQQQPPHSSPATAGSLQPPAESGTHLASVPSASDAMVSAFLDMASRTYSSSPEPVGAVDASSKPHTCRSNGGLPPGPLELCGTSGSVGAPLPSQTSSRQQLLVEALTKRRSEDFSRELQNTVLRMVDVDTHAVLEAYHASKAVAPGSTYQLPIGDLYHLQFMRAVPDAAFCVLGRLPSSPLAFAEAECAEQLLWAVAALCRSLSLENILTLLNAALLEKQAVVFCPNIGMLSAVVLSLVPLLRPFAWQSLLLPVTPLSMLGFLEAPVPFVLGVQFKAHDVASKCQGLVRVNVYKDAIKNATFPSMPNSVQLLQALAPSYVKLRAYASLATQRPVHIISAEEADAARAFLSQAHAYLSGLCGDLRLHTITNVGMSKRTGLLLLDSLIDSFPAKDRPFIRQFTETQMFAAYSDAVIDAVVSDT